MNLDAVTAELRPRGPWEAADLGVRMVRRDAAAIYRVWFSVTLPMLAIALAVIWYTPYSNLAVYGYWWLEPIIDAPILYIISRRLFGEDTSAGAALKATPGLAARNWIFLLPIYRFHFARSVAMPLTQLEGLSGRRRRERAKVMNLTTLNHGIGVTSAYQHLVLSLYFGIVLLAFAFLPEAYRESIGGGWFDSLFSRETRTGDTVLLLSFYAAQTALQPWFVGAGFGLYINCRTILEAWDIEVSFRRMLQARASRLGASTAAVLCALILVAEPLPAAEGSLETWWDAEEVAAAEEKVVNSEAMRQFETVERWVSNTASDANTDAEDDSVPPGFLSALGRFVSFLLEFGFWLLAAALLIAIVATSKRWMPYLKFQRVERVAKSRVILGGVEVTAETLPEDIPATVLRLWSQGERRHALSILYRSSVFHAVEKYGVRLVGSSTEEACVNAVAKQTDASQTDYFKKVVSAWVWCAYASRDPADGTVEALCRDWPQYYGDAVST